MKEIVYIHNIHIISKRFLYEIVFAVAVFFLLLQNQTIPSSSSYTTTNSRSSLQYNTLLLILKSAVSCLKRFVLRHENVCIDLLYTSPYTSYTEKKNGMAYWQWLCFCCTYNVTSRVAMMYESSSILLVDVKYITVDCSRYFIYTKMLRQNIDKSVVHMYSLRILIIQRTHGAVHVVKII